MYSLQIYRNSAFLAKTALRIFGITTRTTAVTTMFPLEFRAEVNQEEIRVMGLSSSEDPMIIA